MDFKSQDVLYGWRCGILGSALRDGSSAEMLRSEEQQESFVACLYYSVFNLLYGGGSVLQEIKQSVSTSFPLEGWGTC